MKNPNLKKSLATLCLLLAAGVTTVRADSLTWDPSLSGGSGGNGTWNLNSTANWWNGSADVNWLDNSASGTNSAIFSGTTGNVTLNSSLSASNLQFTTTGYTLAGAGLLTVGSGGLDTSALGSGTTTISNSLALSSGQQLWQSGAGGTLAIKGSVSRNTGATVDFSATGITSSTLTNVNGTLGGWATVGAANGTASGDWAANDGSGNITTYAGYTVGTAIATGTAAQNWKNTANATVTANVAINSLVQQADVTLSGGATLTLNNGGLVLWGVSRWMLANATTSFLKSGTSSGELFVHVPSPSSGNNWTLWPIIANAAVPAVLIKDGAGMVKLGNNLNTYTGGTIVNGGILASRNPVAAVGLCTPFGSGNITVNNAQLQLGTDPTSASGEYDITNTVTLNSGTIYEADAFQHVQGSLIVGANGGTLGSTYNNKGDALLKGFGKGLFVDGIVTGTGNLTVQHSGINTGNAWNSSTVYFTSPGTAAQNTYSGTITVNPSIAPAGNGGSYLFLIGTNVLANATLNLTGNNSASAGRYGSPTLLFGSGTNLDGVGFATIGGLAGSGSFALANTKVIQSGSSLGNGVALTVGNNNSSSTYSGVMSGTGSLTKTGNGTLTLSGANTYTGNTTISGGTLALNGGSLANTTNIFVGNGATFDVSANGSITLGASQNLFGSGTNNGSVNTTSGSKIYAGTDGGYGTNKFNNDLTFVAGALPYFDVGTLANSTNDRITVAGTLTANNNVIHLKAPSSLVSLQTADYVLFSSPNAISGAFNSAPAWDVAPVNAGNFSVTMSGNNILLHYAASTAPSGAGSATPATVTRNQKTLITVTVTNGSGGTINSVVLDASAIGGSATASLVRSNLSNLYTNTFAPTPDTTAGSKTLAVTLTDTVPLTGLVNIPLTVTIANDVWNGAAANDFFSSNLNWTNAAAPGYLGDSLQFSGTTRLTPSVDNNYSVTSVNFDSTAGSFNVGSANSSTLTVTGGGSLGNDSTNAQTLNVTVADDGNGFTKTGNGTLTLAANTTLTGLATVRAGKLIIPATGNFQANRDPGQFSSSLAIANSTNAASLQLNSGTLTVLRQFAIGNGGTNAATFDMSGGTATIGSFMVVGFNNDRALFNQSSGSLTINNNLITIGAGGTGSIGVANISGGTINSTATTGYGPTLGGILVGEFGSGTLNVSGNANIAVAGRALALGVNGGSAGLVNLRGGTLNATAVSKGSGSGTFNFNGGILQASTGNATFMTGLTAAYIYGGGAVIDDGGNGITIGQPLLAPAGYGVSSITVSNGGFGYIAPPLVTLTGGTGSGASATAQINPVNGAVTGLVINNPGSGYAVSDVLAVNFLGGGGSGAVANAPALATNVSGGLIKLGVGALTLAGTNTFTGSTVVSNGTLALTGSLTSTNISVASGATFDVSGITYALSGSQSLSGSGNNNGNVSTAAGSRIYAGTDGRYGTNTFNNDLELVSGAAGYLDVGTSASGTNDQLIVSGTLTLNNNVLHLKAPSPSVSLDTTTDYVLAIAGAISGNFANAPVWDVAPVNAGNFSIVTGPNTVTLHYTVTSAPTANGSANPATVLRNQKTKITVNVTPGSGTITGVTLDLTPIGGTSATLVRSNLSNVYTNTIAIPAAANPGSLALTATVTDSTPLTGSASIPLTINASSEVWNGAGGNQNWSTNPNWLSGSAPGLIGDGLVFAGAVGLAPNMDNNYSVTGLTFSNNASSFTIGTGNSSALTLTANGIANNSANAQTVNVPVALTSAQTLNAAAGNLTLVQPVDNGGNLLTVSGSNNVSFNDALNGTGGLTKTGNGTLTLAGSSSFTGATTVSAGSAVIPPTGSIAPDGLVTIGNSSGNKAVVTVSGGTLSANNNVSQFSSSLVIGSVTNAAGALQLNSGGTLNVSQQFALGGGTGGYAALDVTGGTASLGSFFVVGFNNDRSVFNQSGGAVTINNNLITVGAGGTGSIGVANLSGGTFSSTATTGYGPTIGGSFIGENGNGTLNVSGSAQVSLSGWGMRVGVNGGAVGIVNLNGGTVTTVSASQGGGTATLNFNGGTLQASVTNANFMPNLNSYLYSGGATIDSATNDITIGAALQAPVGYGVSSISVTSGGAGYISTPIVTLTGGSGSGATASARINPTTGSVTNIVITCPGSGYGVSDTVVVTLIGGGGTGATTGTPVLAANVSGGLTKIGLGTLTLSGANTYTNTTTVNGGILAVTSPMLATNSGVVIASGALLQLDFAATNRIAALVLNGVSQVPGIYNSNSAPAFITGVGSLLVPSLIANNPTNITFSVSGNTMALSWPTDHLGWILQQQTNSLSIGLSTNWFDVAGSASITSTNLTINPAKPAVFYRLRHP